MSKVPTQSTDTREKVNKPKVNYKKPNIKYKPKEKYRPSSPKKCPCSIYQILAIVIPISAVQLFMVIFLSVYLTKNKQKEKKKIYYYDDNNINNTDLINNTNQEYDEFDYFYYNKTFSTLTPKNGYDHIYIHLGGIYEAVGTFSYFFKSNETFIPKGTKIYYLVGSSRLVQYFKEKGSFGSLLGDLIPVPSWFNVDSDGKLVCENCDGDDFAEAKESLNLILDTIDHISIEENIDYDKIYLGGFSQGAIMVNYVLLNSRHKLGGYLAFSGYVFDHNFPPNYVVNELSDKQKQILESKKDYHILAAHSFNDDSVFYSRVIEGYYKYYKDYTDFTLFSFGKLGHDFDDQPTHPLVRKWLKESMGK